MHSRHSAPPLMPLPRTSVFTRASPVEDAAASCNPLLPLLGAEAYARRLQRRAGSLSPNIWVMEPTGERLQVNGALAIPLSEVTIRASRSSGPGGQHANVTASRIEASFDVAASPTLTEQQRRRLMARCGPRVTAVAQDARSQAR